MSKSKLKNVNDKIAEGVTSGFEKMEKGVVGTYQKVEHAFVDKFLTHEGESVEDAKQRLAWEQDEREAVASGNLGRKSVEISREIGRASVEASRNAGKENKTGEKVISTEK